MRSDSGGLSPPTTSVRGLDALFSIKKFGVRATGGFECIINEFIKELEKT